MAIVVPKGSHGAYREQIVLDARSVVRAPAGKTHTEACTLPMNGLTARQSLDLLKLSPGQVIAVTGAAGAYGGYVVQLAKAEGLTVIADASEKDEKLVASLGANIVVRRGDDVASRIREYSFHRLRHSGVCVDLAVDRGAQRFGDPGPELSGDLFAELFHDPFTRTDQNVWAHTYHHRPCR